MRYSGKEAIRLCRPFLFLHFSFMAKYVVYHLSAQNQPTVYWLIFTALTANTFFRLNCRFFLDSYFVVGFSGFCLVMVFYYWPESTTQRNWDQSDRFFWRGGWGRGLFVLLPAVGFSGFCVMTVFYYWQQSTRWKIHGKVIALEKKWLGKSNWPLVQSW